MFSIDQNFAMLFIGLKSILVLYCKVYTWLFCPFSRKFVCEADRIVEGERVYFHNQCALQMPM